ncbi:DNA polymerase alpha subunit B [Monocercomonoides exilis]|uniref:DNA polymerase alpha subunit B n=1 Tax=Monocercomonoides exilis TaxID=2049356 RepID=UPI00355A7E3A|nr:DNA polymerase alpha subunit B [Monocercomonoides exilis]|eukprot:MONOS_11293.1-p1 / transcript=MONOS_11293.1 / gene=MONOS_11293 / organism=Monocercomonoides_exilis_PA203 / gene_product=DNA polymerase alpha subunit B / transcript_product=DNA polymerase alpha subunit B / location=Mono_scaffold00559:22600-25196(+) / protein_length=587 / sequence_SO=supercontig / SO=protein_coding / is_pseudo=false
MDNLKEFISFLSKEGETPPAPETQESIETQIEDEPRFDSESLSAHAKQTFQASALLSKLPKAELQTLPLKFQGFTSLIIPSTINENRKALKTQFLNVVQAIHEETNLPMISDPLAISSLNEKLHYGRIVSDDVSEGHLVPSSILIEDFEGKTMPLRFSVPYCVFPGQTVAIRGTNPQGNFIQVTEFMDGSFPAVPDPSTEGGVAPQGMQIITVQGPFWAPSESQSFDIPQDPSEVDLPILKPLIKHIQKNKPHFVIMFGPFLQSMNDSSLVYQAMMKGLRPELVFDAIVMQMAAAAAATPHTRFILVPSSQDLAYTTDSVIPMRPFEIDLSAIPSSSMDPNLHPRNLMYLVSNPCFATLDGLRVCLFAEDVFLHLNKTACLEFVVAPSSPRIGSPALPPLPSPSSQPLSSSSSSNSQPSSPPLSPPFSEPLNASSPTSSSASSAISTFAARFNATDKESAFCECLLKQRSVYPIYPAYAPPATIRRRQADMLMPTDEEADGASAFAVDVTQREMLKIEENPHLFITPSVLRPFVKKTNDCVFVTGGSLLRLRNFVTITVAPPSSDLESTIVKPVDERIRVDLCKFE